MDAVRFLLLDEQAKRAQAYADKTKEIFGDYLTCYWPLWEASGDVADNIEGTAARDGAYVGVTLDQTGIGDGQNCPLFDGANDYVGLTRENIDVIWDGAELAISAWIKMSGSGVWTDAAYRNAFYFKNKTPYDSLIHLRKSSTNNQFDFRIQSSGTWKNIYKTGMTTVDWFHILFTVSETEDEMKAYYQGVQEGTTQTGLGSWGTLDLSTTFLGAASATPTNVTDGYIAHVVIGNGVGVAAAVQAEVAELATV